MSRILVKRVLDGKEERDVRVSLFLVFSDLFQEKQEFVWHVPF